MKEDVASAASEVFAELAALVVLDDPEVPDVPAPDASVVFLPFLPPFPSREAELLEEEFLSDELSVVVVELSVAFVSPVFNEVDAFSNIDVLIVVASFWYTLANANVSSEM